MVTIQADAPRPASPLAPGRIPQLDGLRAIAFLLVFLNHSVQLPMAWIGVDLFFVLSGFLITGILLDHRGERLGKYIGHFYRRRVQRILPPYLLVLALVLAIVPPPGWSAIWWQYFTFSQNFATAFQSGVGVLNPYWSLAVEEQFYLLWPFVCFFCGRKTLYAVCLAIILLAPILRAIATPHVPFYTVIFALAPFRADLLAWGGLIALIWRDHRAILERLAARLLWAVTIAAAAFLGPALINPLWRATANSMSFNIVGYSLCAAMFALLVTTSLVYRERWFQTPLRMSGLRYIGMVSYTAYLIHEPILHFTLGWWGRWLGSLAGFALTLAFASVSWFVLERPILAMGRARKGSVSDDSRATTDTLSLP